MRFAVKEHTERLNGIRVVEHTIDRREVGSDNAGADEGWVDIAANARPQDGASGGTTVTTYTVTLKDFANCDIEPNGNIEVASDAIISVTSSDYTMSHQMGTMASRSTFTLRFRTEDSNNEGFRDSKVVDNGCDEQDNTLSGVNSGSIIFDLSSGISGVDLEAELNHGSVTQACGSPDKNIDCAITGQIAGEGTTLGDFDSNEMDISLS